MQQDKTKVIEKRNEKAHAKPLKIGQVYVKLQSGNRNKLTYMYNGPYTLKTLNHDNTAIILDAKNNKQRKVHVRSLKHKIVTESSHGASTDSREMCN